MEEQIQRVEELLKEMEIDRIPRILILNKTDCLSPAERDILSVRFPEAFQVAALDKATLLPLLEEMERRLFSRSLHDDPNRVLATRK
jgi:GTP-binding protein HflX